MKRYQARFFVPNNPLAPRIAPEVAKEIGLNESLVLLQLEFWMTTDGEERDGLWWVRKTVREIQQTFGFWGIGTVSRTLNSLAGKGYIVYGDFDEGPGKGASWMRFNMEKIAAIKSIRLFQDGTTVVPNNADSVPDGNNRPYKQDQESIHTEEKFDQKRSEKIGKRRKPPVPTNGRRPPLAMTLLPDPFTPDEKTFARAIRDCPDVDLKLMHRTFCANRISSARTSAAWSEDWYAFMTTCQNTINRDRNRYARSGT